MRMTQKVSLILLSALVLLVLFYWDQVYPQDLTKPEPITKFAIDLKKIALSDSERVMLELAGIESTLEVLEAKIAELNETLTTLKLEKAIISADKRAAVSKLKIYRRGMKPTNK